MKSILVSLLGVFAAAGLYAGNLRIGGIIEADSADSVTGPQAALIIANSNGLLQANANISNVSNGVVSLDAKLVATSNVLASAMGSAGISAPTATNIARAVLAPYTNRIETAWQNPAESVHWTWTNMVDHVELLTYDFYSMAVNIPDMLDGLPVTSFGNIFSPAPDFFGTAITSVTGGRNITSLASHAFTLCGQLTTAPFHNATTIGDSAFSGCINLTTVSLENAETIDASTFDGCLSLISVYLPKVKSVGILAFARCTSLSSVTFSALTAPSDNPIIYEDLSVNQVTNFVANPTATGWGATFGGMPVVRMPIESERVNAGTVISITSTTTGTNTAGYFQGDGSLLTGLPSGTPVGVAYTASNQTFTGANKFANSSLTDKGVVIYGGGVLATNPTVSVQSQYNYVPPYTQTIQDWKNASGAQVAKMSVFGVFTTYSVTATYYDSGASAPTAPAFRSSDGKTGMYFPTTTSLGFSVVNTNRLTISTSSFVSTLPITAPSFIGDGSSVTNVPPMAWTPITTVASASVATATVTTAKSIYYFESDTAVSFTNDLSALSLNCGTNYQWTIVFNATGTNACNSTNWYGVVDFVGGPPELTCTGRYEYACDTSCGTRIRVRQTYPTVYRWQGCWMAAAANNALGSMSMGYSDVLGATATNNIWCFERKFYDAPTVVMVDWQNVSDSVHNVTLSIGTFSQTAGEVFPPGWPTSVVPAAGAGKTYFYLNDYRSLANHYCSLHARRPGATFTKAFRVNTPRARQANELEQAVGTNKLGWASAYQF